MVDSRIEQVTVYARGAAVRRVASASGPGIVRVAGLPAAAIDDTVRVEVEGGPVAVSVRVATDAVAEGASEETAELRAARRREAVATAEVVRLETALDRLAKAPVVVQVDDESEDKAAWAAVVAARASVVEVRAAREAALRGALAAARRELEEAHRAHEVVAMREALKGNAHEAKAHELRKHVELELVGAGAATLRIEYQVAAARWAPAYVARLDGEAARFELRAVVAQDSGEDWRGVSVKLSTAEPARFAQLPELAAQKIGRKQAEPAKKGFRAAPVGADALYADHERAWPRAAPPVRRRLDEPAPEEALAQQVWDEDSSHAKGYPASNAPPPMAMPVASAPMPMVASKRRAGGPLASFGNALAGAAQSMAPRGGGGAPPAGMYDTRSRGEPVAAPPQPRLDYGNLVMAPASGAERGKLIAAPGKSGPSARVAEGVAKIEQLALPPGHDDAWDHTYDFAFAGDGTVDIASDGAWHSIALTARAGTAQLRHVAVPREQADVFRIAEVTNPFDGPLLPGPIDVYDRGQFLVTSEVDYTPPGGRVAIGLGVDPQVKIARNAEFREEAAGVLRGALRLHHAVTVEVENVSPRAVDVEVRERVPVTREGDDDIEVTIGKVEPAWEAWSPQPDSPGEPKLRGGQRWRITVPPAGKKLLRAGYEVRIPAKAELVGGNRREP